MNPLSLNNVSKLDSSQSTVRESSTNFSSMNPAVVNQSGGGNLSNQNAVAQLQHQSFVQQQQLLQRINTLQLQNQSLQNQNLTRLQGNGDYDHFSDRLIESIAMVRDLLVNNKELRETTDQAIKKSEICEKELFHLQRENQDLRDRIQHLKNGGQLEDFNSTAPYIGGATDDENNSLFTNQPLSPSINWKNMQKKDLISEILALRRDKKILERRILGNDIDRSTMNNSIASNPIINPPQNLIRIQNKRISSNNSPIKQQYNSVNPSQQVPLILSRKVSNNNTAQSINNNPNQQNGTPFQGDSLPTNFGRYTFYQNVSQNNSNNNNSINFLSDDQSQSNTNRKNAIQNISNNISPQNLMQSFRQTNLMPRPLLQNISPGKKQNQQYFNGQGDDFGNQRQNYNINNNHHTNRSNSIKMSQQFQNQIPQQHHSFSQSRSQNPNNASFNH